MIKNFNSKIFLLRRYVNINYIYVKRKITDYWSKNKLTIINFVLKKMIERRNNLPK